MLWNPQPIYVVGAVWADTAGAARRGALQFLPTAHVAWLERSLSVHRNLGGLGAEDIAAFEECLGSLRGEQSNEGSDEDAGTINNDEPRAMRGESFRRRPFLVRAAARMSELPLIEDYANGLRLA